MDFKEKKLDSKLIYDGHVVHLFVDDVLCPNGNKSKREYVAHQGGVCILGIIDGKVLIERQYRYAYDEVLYELPAGKLEKGEDSYQAGLREFEEETGYKAESLESYGCMYPSCGYTNEKIYLYVAQNITKSERHLDEDEVIEVEYLSLEDVIKMIDENIIKDAKTICLIGKYLNRHGKN